jgi:uncharacterized membrane protein
MENLPATRSQRILEFLRRRLGDLVLLALLVTVFAVVMLPGSKYWLDFVVAYVLIVFALYAAGKGDRVDRAVAAAAIITFILVELRVLRW